LVFKLIFPRSMPSGVCSNCKPLYSGAKTVAMISRPDELTGQEDTPGNAASDSGTLSAPRCVLLLDWRIRAKMRGSSRAATASRRDRIRLIRLVGWWAMRTWLCCSCWVSGYERTRVWHERCAVPNSHEFGYVLCSGVWRRSGRTGDSLGIGGADAQQEVLRLALGVRLVMLGSRLVSC
jgi:hypothetical protein